MLVDKPPDSVWDWQLAGTERQRRLRLSGLVKAQADFGAIRQRREEAEGGFGRCLG